MATPEAKAILIRTHDLTTALANQPLDVAGTLLSKELISSEVYSRVLLPSYTPTEKAAFMVESARKVVEIAPEKFHKFLEALSEQICANEVIKSLSSTYQSEFSMARLCLLEWSIMLKLYWGEPERAPHKRYSNARNIWYMYICIYVYMYICIYVWHDRHIPYICVF